MSPEVDAWLAALEHPQKEVIAAVRALVLALDPQIQEGIKWNVGSFRTTEWFATFLVVEPKGPRPVTLVLHRGTKKRGDGPSVSDPTGLLTVLGSNRATVSFSDLEDVARKTPALNALLREWIRSL